MTTSPFSDSPFFRRFKRYTERDIPTRFHTRDDDRSNKYSKQNTKASTKKCCKGDKDIRNPQAAEQAPELNSETRLLPSRTIIKVRHADRTKKTSR
jgi:hypothetical protein